MKIFYHVSTILKMLSMIIFSQALLAHGEELPVESTGRAQVEPDKKTEENWDIHFQATSVTQGHPSFPAAYSGINSLSSGAETATSFTATLFAEAKVWKNGEIYVSPEILAGSGISGTLGLGGAPNGEIYRVDNPDPKFTLSRIYFKQVFGMGETQEYKGANLDQRAGIYNQKRFTVIIGKFSLTDFFDNNRYSDDPRTQFLNWSIMYNGAWDFAADTRGYTWGMVLELREPSWAIRLGSVQVPEQANQMSLDGNLSRAHGDNLEFEYRYSIKNHPGITRLMSYVNYAHMGNYRETLINPGYGMDITQDRQYRIKYGFGVNLEQEMTSDMGIALRLGWNDGATETWAFTEIDRTASLTMSLKGAAWYRPADNFGIGVVVNGLSQDHADYLAAGGYGFIIGDGRLSYAPEEILETYYLWKPASYLGISPDFQFVNHPAYNKDRGPVFIMGIRTHFEY
ncbi:MAG: carbohydrate porin [Nitrospiria bacterium]